jgi:hypothetical protein
MLRATLRGGLAAALLFMTGAAPAQDAPRQPIFTFIEKDILLKPDATAGTLYIRTRIVGTKPTLKEFGHDPIPVETAPAVPVGNAALGIWEIPVTVTGLARNALITRHLVVTIGSDSDEGAYTISNVNSQTFALTVTGTSTPQSWADGEPLALNVTVGSVKATHVVLNALLKDDVSQHTLGQGALRLCFQAEGPCTAVEDLEASQSYRLYVRRPVRSVAPDVPPKPGQGGAPREEEIVPPPGKYAGALTLQAVEGASAAIPVTINVTSVGWQLLGILLIVAGVGLSLLITIFIRNRLALDQLIAPGLALRATLAEQAARARTLAFAGTPANLMAKHIGSWMSRLSRDELLKFFDTSALTPPAAKPDYQALLDKAGAWTLAFASIIKDGLEPMSVKFDLGKIPDDKREQAVKDMTAEWDDIQALAAEANDPLPPAPTADKLSADIKGHLDAAADIYKAALPATHEFLAKIDVTPAAARRDVERLRYEISQLNRLSWLISSVLTILVGAYVMVLSHPGFGRTDDLALCFFWGMGWAAAGAQLTQMTPSSIAGSFGINVVKPAA